MAILTRILALCSMMYFVNVICQLQIRRFSIAIIFWVIVFIVISRKPVNQLTLLVGLFSLIIFYGVYLRTTPYSDFASFYSDAALFPDLKVLSTTKSFTTTVVQGMLLKVFGQSPFSGLVVSAALCVIGIYLFIVGSLRLIGQSVDNKRVLYAACYLPLIYFPLWLYAPVFSSESVAVLLLGMLWFAISSDNSFFRSGLVVGTLLALLFLCRSNLLLYGFLIPLLWIGENSENPGNSPLRPQGFMMQCGTILAAFISVIMLYGAITYVSEGSFKITSSPYGALNLLIGTNISTNGGWNEQDVQLVTSNLGAKIDNKMAVRLALERITENPAQFAVFALTKKIGRLWNRYDEWGVGQDAEAKSNYRFISSFTEAISISGLSIVLLFFIVASMSAALVPNPYLLWPLLSLDGMISLHLFIEVQGRYQLPIVIAGFSLVTVVARTWNEKWVLRKNCG